MDNQFSIWQQALAPHSPHQGFFRKLKAHAIVYIEPLGASKLFVAFDDFSRVANSKINRDPWGLSFALDQGWAFLGVMPSKLYWFRDEELFDAMEELRDDGLFAKFSNVLFSGTSMGAFGACAFAKLCPGANVLAFAPQNSLDPDLVPWDRRYPKGSAMNWKGRFASAHDGVQQARKAYIIYDPLAALDKIHAHQITGPGVEYRSALACGHRIALVARNVGILKTLSMLAMEGQLDNSTCAKLMRARRASTTVRNNGVKALRVHDHEVWAREYGRACFRLKQEYLAKQKKSKSEG